MLVVNPAINFFAQSTSVMAYFLSLLTDVTKSENGERGTGNGERGTGNGERGTGNGSLGTSVQRFSA